MERAREAALGIVKACGNCRVIWPDDYNGQCSECGAPMSGMPVNGSNDLARRLAQQRAMALREAQSETALKRGGHANVQVHEAVLEKAASLLVPKEGAFSEDS